MPVRAITFDFWRTLFRDAEYTERQDVRIEAFSKAAGVSRAEVADAFDVTWAEFYRHHVEEERTLYPEDAVRITAETLNVVLAPELVGELTEVFATAILKHPPQPIEGSLDAVRAAAAIRPVGIVSDAGVSPGSSLRRLLERHGFLPYFQALIFSDEVRVAKPQALMFETAARDLGVRPTELLHIGDLEHTDVAGAQRVGAKAGLFTGDNAAHLGATQADYTFTSWRQFVELLPGLV